MRVECLVRVECVISEREMLVIGQGVIGDGVCV